MPPYTAKNNTFAIINKLIDDQLKNLLFARDFLPYLPKDLAGKTTFPTPKYYRKLGITVKLSAPLTEENIDDFRYVAHWTNQNFLIRLHAILEENDIIPKKGKGRIDKTLDGFEAINILRRLRQHFAHTSGKYNPSKADQEKLLVSIRKHFDIRDHDLNIPNEFPIPIDRFLKPLVEGCRRYVVAFYKKIYYTSIPCTSP